MTTPTDEALIAELSGLLEKAKPTALVVGVWNGQCEKQHAHGSKVDPCEYQYTLRSNKGCATVSFADPSVHAELIGNDDYGPILSQDWATLIVAAVNALPTLLDRLCTDQSTIAGLRAEVEEWKNRSTVFEIEGLRQMGGWITSKQRAESAEASNATLRAALDKAREGLREIERRGEFNRNEGDAPSRARIRFMCGIARGTLTEL